MSPQASMRIEGDKQLMKTMSDMKQRTHNNVLKGSMRKGIAIVAKEAKRRAPKGATGNLRRQIGHYTKAMINKGIVWAKVYIRKPSKAQTGKSSDDARRYGYMKEYGTSKQAAEPFMRPALQAKKAEALKVIRRSAWQILQKQLKWAKARNKVL